MNKSKSEIAGYTDEELAEIVSRMVRNHQYNSSVRTTGLKYERQIMVEVSFRDNNIPAALNK